MKSPFPGMDPYLEPHWRDIHASLIGETRRHLNRSLPQGLVARVEERIAIESDDYARGITPDVRVFSPSTADPDEGKSGILIEAPYKIVLEVEPAVERFIRILDASGVIITVIEFISPTNKTQPGLDEFRRKRAERLAGGVHVVEVDLVRSGDWRALMRPERCQPEAVATYRAVIRTAGVKAGGYLFPISFREGLPEIPIPLRAGDAQTKLPLQSLVDAVYADGRYDHTIDYASDLNPAPGPDDAAWIDQLLKSSGRR